MAQTPQPLPGTTRRSFLKFVVAGGSTLVVGTALLSRKEALAQSTDPPEYFDVGDTMIAAEEPYASNLVLEVTAHNRIRFELPRLDKGQGIITAMAMMIAEEMDADYDRVDVELSDARADRPYSLTGYSSTIRAMWEWVPELAAEARARLVTAAMNRWGIVDANQMSTKGSMVIAADGRRASFGELSAEAAAVVVVLAPNTPKPIADYTLIGHPDGKRRKNARDIVTGKQQYTLDIDLPGAKFATLARPPQIYGTVTNFGALTAPPGVLGIVNVPQTPGPISDALEGGVAVVADTFQEAIDGAEALQSQIVWGPGPLDGQDDTDLQATLVANKIPLTTPNAPGSHIEFSFDYPYLNHAPLEVQTAAANVVGDTAELWFASQSPLFTAQLVAAKLGIPEENVTLHVTHCGGSFGRHLFSEAVVEAAIVSQQLAVPIKLMWTRKDDMRNSRYRPMSHHEIRASWAPGNGNVLFYEHNVSAAETDFRHGLGDAYSAAGFDQGSAPLNQSVFGGSVALPYDVGTKAHKLVETVLPVPTCSWRSIWSGFTVASNEIFVDELARATQSLTGLDEVGFRAAHLTDPRALACLNHVIAPSQGNWPGTGLPAGHALGVSCHVEYRSSVAYLVQVDASDPLDPKLVNAWIAVDVGVPINRKGLEAQLQGALMDGWSAMFRVGNTLSNGTIQETSYGDFPWARMHHAPKTMSVHIFDADPNLTPGGCGELGMPPAAAACVNAYKRAIAPATLPSHSFPILEI